MHHTKEKGDIGVLKAQADIAEQGYKILVPLSEHLPFDLVAYKNGEYKRIQVKYRKAVNGSISFDARSTWSDKNGSHVERMDKNQVDIVCLYCPETDKCYYFNPKDMDKSISLRIKDTRNGQSKNVKQAVDYERM